MKDIFNNPISTSAFIIGIAIIIASATYSLSNYYSSVTPFNRCLNESTFSEGTTTKIKYGFCKRILEE